MTLSPETRQALKRKRKPLWTVDAGRICRATQTVATVRLQSDGNGFTWEGFGHTRINCASKEDAMDDCKYFYTYQRNKPLITFRYKSGRKVEVWPGF
jgi:hypothetical protein